MPGDSNGGGKVRKISSARQAETFADLLTYIIGRKCDANPVGIFFVFIKPFHTNFVFGIENRHGWELIVKLLKFENTLFCSTIIFKCAIAVEMVRGKVCQKCDCRCFLDLC